MSSSRSASLAVRRPTVSSKALSATKDKSLSNVSLTKRTNLLVFDVAELKSNLKELQVQGQDVNLQDLAVKVAALQDGFASICDLCTQVEDTQRTVMVTRMSTLEKSMDEIQRHISRQDSKHKQFRENTERRLAEYQEAFSKLTLSIYETQTDLRRLQISTEQLMGRERETTNLLQTLQTSQDQATEWLQKLRQEASQLQMEMTTWKEQGASSDVALAGDVQALAKECASVRNHLAQNHTQWVAKFESLHETIDRQSRLDKTQLTQRLNALVDNFSAHEQRSKEVMSTMLKNHAKIREALDEGMAICSSEIKTLSHEWKTVQGDHRVKLEELIQHLTSQSLEWTQQHEQLKCSVNSLAIQLNVTL